MEDQNNKCLLCAYCSRAVNGSYFCSSTLLFNSLNHTPSGRKSPKDGQLLYPIIDWDFSCKNYVDKSLR